LFAYFIGNISAKKYQIHSRASKLLQAKCGTFFETRCRMWANAMPNVMTALPSTGGALCSTPQSLADAHY